MNTCEEHDDAVVVYLKRNCPVCGLQALLDEANQTIDSKSKEISDLEDEIEGLKEGM